MLRTPSRWILQYAFAAATGFLAILTTLWPDWIEAFGIEPDGGSGTAELLIVIALFALTVVFGGLGYRKQRPIRAQRIESIT